MDPLYNGEWRLPGHVLENEGFFYSQGRLCVPNCKSLRLKLLEEAQSSATAGHPGIKATREKLLPYYWWPHMTSDIADYVKFCPRCQLAKPSRLKPLGLLQPHSTPTLPWEVVGTDLLTDLPVSGSCGSILVFVCLLTKAAVFIPTKKAMSAEAAAHLFFANVFKRFGLPRKLVSDQDVRFTSTFWTELIHLLQTTLNFSTAFHPQTDGQSERAIQQLLNLLRCATHPL